MATKLKVHRTKTTMTIDSTNQQNKFNCTRKIKTAWVIKGTEIALAKNSAVGRNRERG
jgi:hypothetical protein